MPCGQLGINGLKDLVRAKTHQEQETRTNVGLTCEQEVLAMFRTDFVDPWENHVKNFETPDNEAHVKTHVVVKTGKTYDNQQTVNRIPAMPCCNNNQSQHRQKNSARDPLFDDFLNSMRAMVARPVGKAEIAKSV